MSKKNIAVFASGAGSNFEVIVKKENGFNYCVRLLVCNNSNAKAIDIAKQNNIAVLILSKDEFLYTNNLISTLLDYKISLLVLAGFLWKIPVYLIKNFPNKIVNIHPALLPKYGGKGMYGLNIHKAVIQNEETETGITIHLVNEEYDQGKIIYQEKVHVFKGDTPETLAKRVLEIEHHSYAKYIDLLCS